MIRGIHTNHQYKQKELVCKKQHFNDNDLHFNEIQPTKLAFLTNFTKKRTLK